jgi:hypothetical protein
MLTASRITRFKKVRLFWRFRGHAVQDKLRRRTCYVRSIRVVSRHSCGRPTLLHIAVPALATARDMASEPEKCLLACSVDAPNSRHTLVARAELFLLSPVIEKSPACVSADSRAHMIVRPIEISVIVFVENDRLTSIGAAHSTAIDQSALVIRILQVVAVQEDKSAIATTGSVGIPQKLVPTRRRLAGLATRPRERS